MKQGITEKESQVKITEKESKIIKKYILHHRKHCTCEQDFDSWQKEYLPQRNASMDRSTHHRCSTEKLFIKISQFGISF